MTGERTVLLVTAMAFLFGCSIPMERQSTIQQEQRETVTAKTTADVVDRTVSEPASITVESKDVTVTVPPIQHADRSSRTSASESSDSEASGAAAATVKLPLSIALLIGAVALAMILGLLAFAFKKSAALRAAGTWGDSMAARFVNAAKSRAATATDPKVASEFQALASEAQHEQTEWNKP